MNRYSRIIAAFQNSVWAILPEKFAAIKEFLFLKAEGGAVSEEDIALLKKEQREPTQIEAFDDEGTEVGIEAAGPSSQNRSKDGNIAVLPMSGTILHRMGSLSEISGGTSTERFSGWLRAALNDSTVKAIVIDCDSPGGTVYGVQELADEIFKGRSVKTIVGQVNALCASAAYYLLSQCSEIVITPSGQAGSIGVFAAHEDMSKALEVEGIKLSLVSAGKYKTEGNPFEPLSDEGRAALQAQVNGYYDQFVNAVARGRGVSADDVRAGFGEGRVVSAQQAVKQKMVDRIGTLNQTLNRLGAQVPNNKQMSAESGTVLPGTCTQTYTITSVAVPASSSSITFAPDTDLLDEQARRERELEL